MMITYREYLELNDDKRYEVINGRLCEMPAPLFEHQDILKRLFNILFEFAEKGYRMGKVIPSPFDVILSEHTVVQPDIVFISKENLKNIKEGRYEKLRIYEEVGIKEYWLVYPGEKAIGVWVLKEGKYELYSIASNEGKVKSKVLEGFEVDLKEVFDGSL